MFGQSSTVFKDDFPQSSLHHDAGGLGKNQVKVVENVLKRGHNIFDTHCLVMFGYAMVIKSCFSGDFR